MQQAHLGRVLEASRERHVTKASVQYTDHGSEAEHCSICEHFRAPDGCEVVAGRVVRGGWCARFRRRNKDYARGKRR